jgi:hypothetical protein
MSNIFTLDNTENFTEKINIDELYEKKRIYDLNKLNLFNKLLNNIHKKIKITSRQKIDNQFYWYLVPEIILGVPKYDQGACIAYLISKLNENGFNVRYIHPNVLFISWAHWIPSYVRNEIKKKTGIKINEYGQKVIENDEDENTKINNEPIVPNNYLLKQNETNQKQNKKEYTSIKSYKPLGNLVYDDEILNKIENKLV